LLLVLLLRLAAAFRCAEGGSFYDGTTKFKSDYTGWNSPEVIFLLNVTEPVAITLTTCPLPGIAPEPYANFNAVARIYDDCPALPDFLINPSATFKDTAANLVAESDGAFYCVYLKHAFYEPGKDTSYRDQLLELSNNTGI
jgi:hypothetical protein